MTKEEPNQVTAAESEMSETLNKFLRTPPDYCTRLLKLKIEDNNAMRQDVDITKLTLPDNREANLLTYLAFRELGHPDEEQMLGLFEYVFEKKQCNPNHVTKVGDNLSDVATAFFNESGNMYVNTFLHTLIVNEHRFASGKSLVEYVLGLPSIKKHFEFDKRDKIIKGPEGKKEEKEGKTILCLAAKMREAVIVKKLCELKKEGCKINLNLEDEDGHTALFYSYALGDLESTDALLEAGANLNLVDKDKINYFQNNPAEVANIVANILKSVSINPERDEKALRNFFVHPNNHQAQLSDDHKINKGNVKTITDTINSTIYRIKYEPTEYERKLTIPASKEFLAFAKMQILDADGESFLTGKSLLQSCLDGQVKCYNLLSSRLAESPPASTSTPNTKAIQLAGSAHRDITPG